MLKELTRKVTKTYFYDTNGNELEREREALRSYNM